MPTPSLAFMWHMHQPYYRNMTTGDCVQPWVRLHGTRSYYDMLKLHEEFPEINTNINFVPSLLRQIREYVEQGMNDKFLELTMVPAKDLTQSQKIYLLRNFFMANHNTMIRPFPRYWKLLQQRGTELKDNDLEEATRYFSWQDYLDIQVFYNLCWFGFKAREENPEVEQLLINKGSHFSEEDKVTVINLQRKVLNQLLNAIKTAPKNIELTTTPFFHPILPLIIDTNIAKRCMPDATLPPRFTAPAHAKFQINHGLTYFEQTVGHKPVGMWPAEGSVCPEMIPLLAEAGIKWIATDEGILRASGFDGKKEDFLYQPYVAEYEGSKVNMVFRDTELSNLLSFTYGPLPAQRSIEDFVERIKGIASRMNKDCGLITVLLDGENPWETYEQGGKPFLSGLFNELKKINFRTTKICDYIEENPPKKTIKKLFSGSWINSNFAIWVGKKQKNQGWDYIKRTVDELGSKLKNALDNPSRSQKELMALESFGAACGSDWFWWFDDDFESAFKSDFDKIFRMHLKNVSTLLGRDTPVYLFNPIFKYQEYDHFMAYPPSFMYPIIDGKDTSFLEWVNAVRLNIGKHYGPMGQTDELFETIYFGFNEEAFFLRVNPLKRDVPFALGKDEEVVIYIHDGPSKYKLRLFSDGEKYNMEYVSSPDEGYTVPAGKIDFQVKSIFEMGLKYSDLGYKPGEELTVILTIVRHGMEVRRYSHITFKVPDETYEKQMWSV